MPKAKKAKKILPTDPSLVYYGPHECKVCDKISGKKESLIVKAGNGAPEDLEFDVPKGYEKSIAYPNTHLDLKWKKHKHITK